MNPPLRPEVPLPGAGAEPPPVADGVQRYVWEGRFGPMRVEVAGESIFVNGRRVERVGASEEQPP